MRALTAKDIMTQGILTAQADWSLEKLSEFLIDNYISGAPVVDGEGNLIGVVSLTDIARYSGFHGYDVPSDDPHDYYQQMLQDRYAREEIAALRIEFEPVVVVSDIMTPMIFQVSEDTPAQEVADTMIRGHIHRLFVTRDKKVVGLISAFDMLKIIREL